ncbi:MAG: hypothetical protein AABZ29_09080 [Gemmatimonadota bacterium]
MNLRLFANVFAVFFALVGVALVITGIGIVASRPVGASVVCVVGISVLSYAVHLGIEAAQRRFPQWIRDLSDSVRL